jgi:uncharacterized protein YegJ (DUF2314 family)
MFVLLVTASSTSFAQGALDRAKRSETTSIDADDPLMRAAYSRALASLPEFLRMLDQAPPHLDVMAIKLGIPAPGGQSEFFWISSVRREGSGFKGVIGNRPNFATHVSMGDEIRFTQQQIVDWTYRDKRTGQMHGNFTGCAILSRETPAEQKRFRDAIGLRCD